MIFGLVKRRQGCQFGNLVAKIGNFGTFRVVWQLKIQIWQLSKVWHFFSTF